MVYLDYSATTPTTEEVLETFSEVSRKMIGNPNSLHALGVKSKELMERATEQVADLLNVKKEEVIFTSGASESNNLALLGVLGEYPSRGKQIITTSLEHSSIKETLQYIKTLGYTIQEVHLLEDGTVDLEHLKELLKIDTILVTIGYVSSELGVLQPMKEIGTLLENYPRTIFHVDGTQAVGKVPVSLEKVDLFSFSAHKFYGLKGIGCLIKKRKIELIPQIHGGKSQTIYRSGTPPVALIVSCAKALRLALLPLEERYQKVVALNQELQEGLEKLSFVVINSPKQAIPHILNISLPGIKPESLIHALEQKEIYVSTQTACSTVNQPSSALIALQKSKEEAMSSIRISLSYQTTKEEILLFLKNLEICYQALNLEKREH